MLAVTVGLNERESKKNPVSGNPFGYNCGLNRNCLGQRAYKLPGLPLFSVSVGLNERESDKKPVSGNPFGSVCVLNRSCLGQRAY